jgi:hypothetical protein
LGCVLDGELWGFFSSLLLSGGLFSGKWEKACLEDCNGQAQLSVALQTASLTHSMDPSSTPSAVPSRPSSDILRDGTPTAGLVATIGPGTSFCDTTADVVVRMDEYINCQYIPTLTVPRQDGGSLADGRPFRRGDPVGYIVRPSRRLR